MPKEQTQTPTPLNVQKEEKDPLILVRATRIGIYGDQRRYPLGHGHPKSGKSFWVRKSEFSDSSKKLKGTGMNGWMEIYDPKVPVEPEVPSKPLPKQEGPSAGDAGPESGPPVEVGSVL